MSSIIQKPKHKKIETEFFIFNFNFQGINFHIFLFAFFIISLLVGYIYYDDNYYQFNQLPDNRNELMPIKSMNISISDECVIKTEIVIHSIIKQTFSNLYQNIITQITENNPRQSNPYMISVHNADSVTSSHGSFCFYKKLTDYHNFTAKICLFDEPISENYFFSC